MDIGSGLKILLYDHIIIDRHLQDIIYVLRPCDFLCAVRVLAIILLDGVLCQLLVLGVI